MQKIIKKISVFILLIMISCSQEESQRKITILEDNLSKTEKYSNKILEELKKETNKRLEKKIDSMRYEKFYEEEGRVWSCCDGWCRSCQRIPKNKIKRLLYKQQIAWNNGDVYEFMRGYWNSENLIFESENHKTTYGWQATLDKYKESYPNKESMGMLKLEILNIDLIGFNHNFDATPWEFDQRPMDGEATVEGKWELIRNFDNPKGSFKLDLELFDGSYLDGDWLITKDYTTEE